MYNKSIISMYRGHVLLRLLDLQSSKVYQHFVFTQ